MEYIGQLVSGDFEDNTMTFEIEGLMVLKVGKYKIVRQNDKSLNGQMKMESIVNHWSNFTESEFENWIKNK
tara:strand:- start:2009 stop:2221 length:213 start_codon:yes stop_codon:yes gene_type:complete